MTPESLMGRWRDATVARMPLIDDEWWDPTCAEVVQAVIDRRPDELGLAVEALAATRSNQRWTIAEGLDDLRALVSVLDHDHAMLVDSLDVASRYAASWVANAEARPRSCDLDPLTRHPTPRYFVLRLREHLEQLDLATAGDPDPWTVLAARLVEVGDVVDRLARRVAAGAALRRVFAGWPRAMEDSLLLAAAPGPVARRSASELMKVVEVDLELHPLPETAWGIERLVEHLAEPPTRC